MKSFAFTARDASGATTRGHLSADDRAAAVREIRARGLVPLSIEEGAAPAGGARGLPGARVIALAAGALLAAVALVALLARRRAWATLITAPLLGWVFAAGDVIKVSLQLPFQITDVIIGVTLLLLVASEPLLSYRPVWHRAREATRAPTPVPEPEEKPS